MLVPAQLLPFEKVDPVLWYVAATRDPDFFTYGVIAQSLLGLGWFEVIVRGLLVGVILALVHNWWARSPANLWRNVFYIWLAVVSYYTVRGTSFYLATLVLLRFVPLVLAVQFFTRLLRFVAKRLEIEHIENRAQRVFGINARAVRNASPNLCFDVDTLEDYEYAVGRLARG